MLEKINNFLDKFLKWKVVLYLILGDIVIMPYTIIISAYKIPTLFNVIMILSVGVSISLFSKAIKNILEEWC